MHQTVIQAGHGRKRNIKGYQRDTPKKKITVMHAGDEKRQETYQVETYKKGGMTLGNQEGRKDA